VQNGRLARPEVVITGCGVLSPLGLGSDALWSAVTEQRSGVARISTFDTSGLPVHIAGEVREFDAKQYVRPRKSLKVMARDTQFGVTVSELACQQAGITAGSVDPDRMGVVFGADIISTELSESMGTYRACMVEGKFDFSRWGEGMHEAFPLLFLKILPNMIASHIAIAQDARGPNNTIHQGDVSSLVAIAEAVRVIQRGAADVMLTGAASSRMQPFDWIRACKANRLSTFGGDPQAASRPFDAARSGQVRGEGAAALVLESREHALARGATILASVVGAASSIEPRFNGRPACGVERAIRLALRDAQMPPEQIGFVMAHGLSTIDDDRGEAAAICRLLGKTHVTALSSYMGNLCAAAGTVQAVAAIEALAHRQVPVTLNYETPDEQCPVNVVTRRPVALEQGVCLVVNQTSVGQAAALLIRRG
jgi:3-oxoacyl-[acyl-carrier-protein] synthase II